MTAFPGPATTDRELNRYERQKQRILDTATTLLNQKGMLGMTLADVSGALGLTTTSVTYYFPRKDQLVEAVFEDALTRLGTMVDEAGLEPDPRRRVKRYLELFFDDFVRAQQDEGRPIANLSEMRSLQGTARDRLLALYRGIFRNVRDFFGPPQDNDRKRLLTARAHVLNEALFWQSTWLGQFAIGDLTNVCRRLFNVFDGGIAAPGTRWTALAIDPDPTMAPHEQDEYLRVATRLINDTGYRGASVKRIMAEFSRTKGSFYYRLDTKDNLVASCWRRSSSRLTEMRRRADLEHASPWQRMSATVTSALRLQIGSDFPLLRMTAYQAMPPMVRELALLQAQQAALGFMGDLVEAMSEGTVRTIDPLIGGHLMLSSINAAYELRKWRDGQSIEQAIITYEDVLGNGLFDR